MATNSPSTHSSLLLQACDQNAAAWFRMAETYGPLIYAWSRHRGLSAEDSGDVVQETMAAVHQAIDQFVSRGRGSFRGWMWTIATRKITDIYRQQKRQPQADGGTDAQLWFNELPAEPPTDDTSLRSANQRVCHAALDRVKLQFEDATWQMFWLCTIEGKTPGEIADAYGVSKAAVRKAKSRVLLRLRQELGEFPNH